MIKNKTIIFFFIFILVNNCSFDSKTGIWDSEEEEKVRISKLEKKQREIIETKKIYSSENIYADEVPLKKKIILSKPIRNSSWEMSGLNHKNFVGNIYLSGIDNIFLKKKIGKNKFLVSSSITLILSYEDNLIFSDDRGIIYNIKKNGKVNWKQNIYKKTYKKIYKSLTLAIYNNNIYIADNIGFIYAINLDTGKLIWIKNHGISIKSNIKIFDNKIFLIDQDNRIFAVNTMNGEKIWEILTISSFIKSQNLLSLAISKKGNLFAINSSADLFKIDTNIGNVFWTKDISSSALSDATDFFRSSEIVSIDNEIIFSTDSSFFSFNVNNSSLNWEKKVSSVGAPIVDKNNIFIVSSNGYFIILEKDTGKTISSTNILKILKKRKQETKVSGFVMGSGKIYAVTSNGYLIVCSASLGKAEYFKKIGDPILSNPIISNGELYILTQNSKIIGFK